MLDFYLFIALTTCLIVIFLFEMLVLRNEDDKLDPEAFKLAFLDALALKT